MGNSEDDCGTVAEQALAEVSDDPRQMRQGATYHMQGPSWRQDATQTHVDRALAKIAELHGLISQATRRLAD